MGRKRRVRKHSSDFVSFSEHPELVYITRRRRSRQVVWIASFKQGPSGRTQVGNSGQCPIAGTLRGSQGLGSPLWGTGLPPSPLQTTWGSGGGELEEHLHVSAWEDVKEPSLNFCCPLVMNSRAKGSISITINKGLGGPRNSNVPLIVRAFKVGTGDRGVTLTAIFSVFMRIK